MNNKYIKILTIFGLVAILLLQGVWLYSTYSIIEDQLKKESKDMFTKAVTMELYQRMENYSSNVVEEKVHIALNDLDLKNPDPVATILNTYIQHVMDTMYHTPVNFPLLDSIYVANLKDAHIYSEVHYMVCDTLNNVLREYTSTGKSVNVSFGTSSFPLRTDGSIILKAELSNPLSSIFRQMAMLLLATIIIMAFVAYCIIYQIKIINRQNKIAQIREDFSYAMVHDMKTPLSSIIMCTKFLHSGKLDDKPEMKDKYYDIVEKESDHLLMLTNKILTLSKLENHRLEMKCEEIELGPMIESLIVDFMTRAIGKKVTFESEINASTVYADEEFLKEALSNLIDNSIKYSNDTVIINISSEESERYTLIKVHDNGLGISEKDMQHIFDKFERASATKRTKSGGASGFGLGLNYVYQVMEAHGGKVIVNSIENEFSEFTLFFPHNNTTES